MQDPLASIIIGAQFAAAIALFVGVLTTIGQARIACAAIEGITRQPEAKSSINTAMFAGLAMAETGGIYGLVVAILLLFANPLVGIFLENTVR